MLYRDTTLLALDEIINNNKVKIVVCNILLLSESIVLFVNIELLINYIPILKIKEKESYYNINIKKLIIIVTPTFTGIKKSVYRGDFTSKTVLNRSLPAISEKLPSSNIVLIIENIKLPLYTTIKAIIKDITTNITKSSNP